MSLSLITNLIVNNFFCFNNRQLTHDYGFAKCCDRIPLSMLAPVSKPVHDHINNYNKEPQNASPVNVPTNSTINTRR